MAELERQQRLFRYEPLTRDHEGIPRQLYLTEKARDFLLQAGAPTSARHPDGISDEQLEKLNAVLTAYVRGKELIENEDLKHLIPRDQEVWAFRSGLALRRLHLRLFGWFAAPNHFVAVHGKQRGKVDFEKEKKRVVEARRALMPNFQPYRGVSYADYIY